MSELSIIKNPEKIDYIKWMHIVDNEIKNQSDRALVLVCASIIDEQLEFILKTFLIEDNHTQERIFDNNAPISTFSAKNNLCFYLGLISKHEYYTINTIRKIRNKFAHEILINTFEDNPSISGLCSNLTIPKGMYVPDTFVVKNNHIQNLDEDPLKDKTAKERFTITFRYITQYLNARYLDIYPIKRKEYTAKTLSKIIEETFKAVLDGNQELLTLLKKQYEFLNEQKELCRQKNIDFSPDLQAEMDKIFAEIKIRETNPFSTKEGSILDINPETFLKMTNTVINDLKEHENKDT